jgi:hypothetical protein
MAILTVFGLIALRAPESRPRAILVGGRKPAVPDHIGGQDRGKLPGFGHGVASALKQHITNVTR